MRESTRPRIFDLGWSLALTAAILIPLLLQRGPALRGDMVFVPEQPWKAAWLGLDGTVPRSVPMDAIVWTANQALPGDLVQRLFLLVILVGAGVGAARLVGQRPWYARMAATTLFVWNPWVLERLSIGQWAILAGYAVLPWCVTAAVRVRDDVRRDWPALGLALIVAGACGPSSGLMATLVAACVCAFGGVRPVLAAVGLGTVGNLPWLVPALLVPGTVASDGDAFTAFAARAESGLGTVASLASLGGIWKTSVIPAERTNEVVVAASCVLTVFALAGLRSAARRLDRNLVRALTLVGAGSVVVVVVAAQPWASGALDDAARAWPPLAAFRDGHRWIAPFALCLVVGLADRVEWLVRRSRDNRQALAAVAGCVVVAPLLLLPSLVWGITGKIAPVEYPDGWATVSGLVADQPAARTVVLPWAGSYRGFGWNDRRAALDPAPRIVPGEVYVDDRVFLGDRVIGSETRLQQQLTAALDSDDPATDLRELGVRWVLVEKDQPSARDTVVPGEVVHDDDWLRLVDLGTVSNPESDKSWGYIVVLADSVTVAMLILCFWCWARRRDSLRPEQHPGREI